MQEVQETRKEEVKKDEDGQVQESKKEEVNQEQEDEKKAEVVAEPEKV